MGDRSETLRVTLAVDGSGQVTGSISGVKKEFSELGSKAIELNQGLELVAKGFDLVEVPLARVVDFAQESLAKFSQQELAIGKLNAELRNSRQFTRGYSDELVALSDNLERTTRFEQEQILATERLLLAYGASRQQIAPLTQSVADLASGLGIDLEGAALKVGKVLDGNEAALSRLGIRVDGHLPKAQQLAQLQQQINEKFGGQAAADVEGYAGQIGLLTKGYDNLQKSIGGAIATTPEFQALIKTLTVDLNAATDAVKGTSGSFVTDFVGTAIPLAVNAVGVFETALFDVVKVFEVLNALRPDKLAETVRRISEGVSLTPMADALEQGILKTAEFQNRFEATAAKIRAEAAQSAKAIADGAKQEAVATNQATDLIASYYAEAAKAADAAGEATKRVGDKAKEGAAAVQQAVVQKFIGSYIVAGQRIDEFGTKVVNIGEQVAEATKKANVKADVTLGLALDPSKAKAQADQFVTEVGGKAVTLGADFDLSKAIRTLDILRARIADTPEGELKIALKAEATDLESEIAAFRERAESEPVTIPVIADTSAAAQAIAGLGKGGIGTVQFGTEQVVDPFAVFQKLGFNTFDVPLRITASGSPTLPFTEYWQNYAPAVISDFVRRTNAEAVDVFSGASEVLARGASVGATALGEQITEVEAFLNRFGSSRPQLNPPIVSGFNLTPESSIGAQQSRNTELLLVQMLEELKGLVGEMRAAGATGERTAKASEAIASYSRETAARSGELLGAMASGRFWATGREQIERDLRARSGDRGRTL
jgi:hypothetical protein